MRSTFEMPKTVEFQNRICVFAAGQNGSLAQQAEARQLGELIAEHGYGLVYGGYSFGLMGAVARGAKSRGAEITGVLPGEGDDPYFMQPKVSRTLELNDRVVHTGSLEDRKLSMLRMADGVIALAGGIGTFDEIATTVERSRGVANGKAEGRLVLVNSDGFYEGLRMQLDRMHGDKLAGAAATRFAYFAEDAEDAMQHLHDQLEFERAVYSGGQSQ